MMGINSRGKIANTLPETKGFFRHVTADNQQFFVVQQGANTNAVQAATGYKTYRDRLGYGNYTYAFAFNNFAVQTGIKTIDQYGNADPQNIPTYNIDNRSNDNGALGNQAFVAHTQQGRAQVRNCTGCHFNLNGANDANQVAYAQAQVGANPNGYQAAQSGYVQFFQNETIVRNNTNQPVTFTQGYLLDANQDPTGSDGLAHRLDWVVRLADGFPLVYSNHRMLSNASIAPEYSRYRRTYDSTAAGPFTQELLRRWDPADAQYRVMVAPLVGQE